jgi:tetraacyldisaccharide 4'-kinase
LLLAEVAPAWTGADRATSARAAIAEGAQILVMDDGLQNPTLFKDLSLLIVDGGFGFGNGRIMPAGPLRESAAACAARCQAAVLIGEDISHAGPMLPPGLPVLRAALVPVPEAASLAGHSVLAFAGIGRPEKFFLTLSRLGAVLGETLSFPDHHRYTEREIRRILDRAERLGAVPATTPKDAVRIPAGLRGHVRVVGVSLAWEEPDAIENWLGLAAYRCHPRR